MLHSMSQPSVLSWSEKELRLDSGVVHQDVQLAELGHGLLYGPLPVSFYGYVHWDVQDVSALGLDLSLHLSALVLALSPKATLAPSAAMSLTSVAPMPLAPPETNPTLPVQTSHNEPPGLEVHKPGCVDLLQVSDLVENVRRDRVVHSDYHHRPPSGTQPPDLHEMMLMSFCPAIAPTAPMEPGLSCCSTNSR